MIEAFRPIENELSDAILNNISGLEHPTDENVKNWILKKLLPRFPMLSKLEVRRRFIPSTLI